MGKMLTSFDLGDNCSLSQDGSRIRFYKGCYYRIDEKALKEWVEEATKPRYYVEKDRTAFRVIDSDKKRHTYDGCIANFFKEPDFDAEEEAEKLCKELNERVE